MKFIPTFAEPLKTLLLTFILRSNWIGLFPNNTFFEYIATTGKASNCKGFARLSLYYCPELISELPAAFFQRVWGYHQYPAGVVLLFRAWNAVLQTEEAQCLIYSLVWRINVSSRDAAVSTAKYRLYFPSGGT